MKKIIKIFLPFCITGVLVSPLFSIASCNKQTPINIQVDKKSYVCYEHEFTMNYSSNQPLPQNTSLAIIGAGSDLYVDQEKTVFGKQGGVIAFKINSNIHFDKQINFSLRFNLGDTDFYVEDLQVYYVFQEEEYKDKVRATQKSLTNVDSWNYVYRFQFENMPLSNVQIRLVGGISYELLTVIQPSGEVYKDGSFYYLDVPIDLSYGVVDDYILSFDIEFTFTNSFGFTQITTINDLSCNFKITPTDEIPEQLFKIDGNKLVGFKDDVTSSTIQHFSTIRIPSGVIQIYSSAFSLINNDKDTYKTITKLIIPNSVSLIGDNKRIAFENLLNLEELDLSGYGTNWPFWLNPLYSHLFNYKMFNTESSNHKSGIVWVGETLFGDRLAGDTTRGEWINNLKRVGLGKEVPIDGWKHSWTPYALSEATSEDWFEIDNQTNTLLGVRSSKITESNLKNLSVIKIPDKITSISITPTNSIKDFSCFSEVGCAYDPIRWATYQPDMWPRARQLILNKNLEEICLNSDGHGAFEKAGIWANIILPNSLTSIAENTFKDVSYMKTISEDIQWCGSYGFECSTNPSLRIIGENAFEDGQLEYITIPASINRLGDSLFKFTKQDQYRPQLILSLDFSNFLSVPTESEIEASTPLLNLPANKTVYIYINNWDLQEEWKILLKKWYNNTDLPSTWYVIKK